MQRPVWPSLDAGSAKTSDAGDAPAAEPSAAARPKLTLQPKQSGELEGPAKPKVGPAQSSRRQGACSQQLRPPTRSVRGAARPSASHLLVLQPLASGLPCQLGALRAYSSPFILLPCRPTPLDQPSLWTPPASSRSLRSALRRRRWGLCRRHHFHAAVHVMWGMKRTSPYCIGRIAA